MVRKPLLKISKQTAAKIAKKRTPSKWVQFLKQKVAETGESYGCLASKPEIREEYRALNPKPLKKSEAKKLEKAVKLEEASVKLGKASGTLREKSQKLLEELITNRPVVDNTEIPTGEVLDKEVVVPEEQSVVRRGPLLKSRKKPVVDNTEIQTGEVLPKEVVVAETQVSGEPANSL